VPVTIREQTIDAIWRAIDPSQEEYGRTAYEAAKAAILALPVGTFSDEPMAYRPISTAPRDGTIVDLWLTGGGRVSDHWWESEDSTWCGLEESMFSHWAPIPIFADEAQL
jgi:hypothetical protein